MTELNVINTQAGSIMHYDAYAFAKNVAYPTITAKKKDGKQLGQREGFSEVLRDEKLERILNTNLNFS